MRVAAALFASCMSAAVSAAAADGAELADPPYKVIDGFKVDARTMNGFRAWRAAACDRCHGANQQGLVGPSLLVSMKTMGRQEFVRIVSEGRLEKGMPGFNTSKTVMDNTDGLYAYLKGRSDGAITQARVQEMQP